MNKGTVILLVLCLLAIVAGTAVIFEATAYQKKAKITEGTVTDKRMSSFHVTYRSDDRTDHNLYVSAKNIKYREGDKIKVFYRMDNPDKARITDGKKGGKKIIIFAVVLLLFDFYMIYTNRKNINVSNNF